MADASEPPPSPPASTGASPARPRWRRSGPSSPRSPPVASRSRCRSSRFEQARLRDARGGGTLDLAPPWDSTGRPSRTASASGIAAERGFRYLEVDASDDSRPILERLGFTTATTTTPRLVAWASVTRETRFAKTDGVHLAYQVVGSGPVDVVIDWSSRSPEPWRLFVAEPPDLD